MTRYLKFTFVLFAFAWAGCEQAASSDIHEFCMTPDDCTGLVGGECLAIDCADGQCKIVPDSAAEGSVCGMADPCAAVAGTCRDGVCTGTVEVECPAVDCMSGRCDTDRGECVYTPSTDRSACDLDGNPCTDDVCLSGVCSAGENVCPCKTAADCPALDDLCLGRYQCTVSSCVIEPQSAVVCPEPGLCDRFTCVPETGECTHEKAIDGTICTRADVCTTGGVCDDGTCVATPKCSDGNPCTDDVCDAQTGACSFPANSAACDDGDACTGKGTCSGGSCLASKLSCDDGNDCTLDGCDEVSGCVNEPVPAGTVCLSSDPCEAFTVCDGQGACGGGRAACDDGNECTGDSCDPSNGECSYENVQGTCDDGNPCTQGERCVSGVCGAGVPVPGCCNFDADCDDRDACTSVVCDKGKCLDVGQDRLNCPPVPSGCLMDWCDAGTGGCGSIDTGIPVVMAAWDFASGEVNQGFVWGEPAGRIGANGMTAPDIAGAQFLLPRRLIPPGVVMAYVGLSSGGCGDVWFSRPSDSAECIDFEGLTWIVASFLSTGAVDEDSRLDVRVSFANAAVVSRTFVYLWHTSGCDSDSIAVGEASVSDLSMSADMDGAAVVYNSGSAITATVLSRDGRVDVMDVEEDPFAVLSGRFSTSVARSGRRYAAAWGGADDEVRVATFDAAGWGPPTAVPDIGAEGQIEAWPSLASLPGGGYALALAYGDGSDFDIAVGKLDANGNLPAAFDAPVNEATLGLQSQPALVFGDDSGLVVWAHEISGELNQYKIVGRKLSSDLTTSLSQFDLETKSTIISSPHCVHKSGNFWCLWQRIDGVVGGVIIGALTYEIASSFSFGSAAMPDSRPVILPYMDGAVAVSIEGTGASASIVARTISVDGTVGTPQTVVSPVLASATYFAADRFGPDMFLVAWTDFLGDPGGLRVKVFSPKCPSGFVDGGAVCTGLGDGRDGGVPK